MISTVGRRPPSCSRSEGRGDRIGHFVPVDFDLQAQWRDDEFFAKHRLFKGKRNAPVVLDFPFHPGTAFWFDHHLSPFKKEAWGKSSARTRNMPIGRNIFHAAIWRTTC